MQIVASKIANRTSKLTTRLSIGQLTLIKNTNELDEQIAALERLNNDVHKRKYDDVRVAKLQPASLMTPEQIKLVLSSDYLKENAEMQRMANRMKSTISEFRYSASKQSGLKEQKGQKGAKK